MHVGGRWGCCGGQAVACACASAAVPALAPAGVCFTRRTRSAPLSSASCETYDRMLQTASCPLPLVHVGGVFHCPRSLFISSIPFLVLLLRPKHDPPARRGARAAPRPQRAQRAARATQPILLQGHGGRERRGELASECWHHQHFCLQGRFQPNSHIGPCWRKLLAQPAKLHRHLLASAERLWSIHEH